MDLVATIGCHEITIGVQMISAALCAFTKLVVGASGHWVQPLQNQDPCIFYANHSSHLDTLALWSALPPEIRRQTRAVAAADYWGKTALRRKIALQGLNAVLINRAGNGKQGNPLEPLYDALQEGSSLIIFPEGTRREQELPGEFKAGLFHLAARFPEASLIPVYLDNLHRSMPKGSYLPLPFLCRVRFGAPLVKVPDEAKADFLQRAREAILQLT